MCKLMDVRWCNDGIDLMSVLCEIVGTRIVGRCHCRIFSVRRTWLTEPVTLNLLLTVLSSGRLGLVRIRGGVGIGRLAMICMILGVWLRQLEVFCRDICNSGVSLSPRLLIVVCIFVRLLKW